jgi:hypothetical protein
MIVSRKDNTTVIPKRKRGVANAVFRDAGDPQYEMYTQGEQKPTFNLSKRIGKPFGLASLTGSVAGFVPLKCNQLGSHAGNMLFNATEGTPMPPLKFPHYRATDLKLYQTEEVQTQTPNYEYLDSLRPSARALKKVSVIEPTDPYPTRPSRSLNELVRGL